MLPKLKKLAFLCVVVLTSLVCKSQGVFVNPNPNGYGVQYNRVKVPKLLVQPSSCGQPTWAPTKSEATGGIMVKDTCNGVWWDWDKGTGTWKQLQGAGGGAADFTFPNAQIHSTCAACGLLNYVAGDNYVTFIDSVGVFFRIDDTASAVVDNVNIFWGSKNNVGDSLIKWRLIANAGGGGSAIDTTPLHTQIVNLQSGKTDKFFYNVKDYGAKGDGVTDDGPALRALFALINTHGGGEVFFPAGTYIVKRDVNSPFYCIGFGSNVKIHGESKTSTILKLDTSDVFNFRRMFQNFDDGTIIQNVEIYDLGIDMSNTFTTYNPPFTVANGYPYDFGNDAQNNAIFLYSTSGKVKNVYIHDILPYNVTGDEIGISKNAQDIIVDRIHQWNYLRQGISVGGSGGVKNIYISHIFDSTFTGGIAKGGNSIHYEPAYPISNIHLSNSTVTDISTSGVNSGSITNVTTTDTAANNIANNVQNFVVLGGYFAGKFQVAPAGDNVLIEGGTFNKGIKITSVGVGGLKTYKNIKVEGIISRAYADFALQISNQSNVSVNNSNLTSYSSVALNCSSCVNASFTNNIISIGDTTGNYYAASIGNTSAYYGLGTITFKGNRLSSPYRGVTIANTGVIYGAENVINAPAKIVATGTYTKYFPYINSGGRQVLNTPNTTFPNYGVWALGDEITLGSSTSGSTYKYICSTAGASAEEAWDSTHTYYANQFVTGSNGHIYQSLQINGQTTNPVVDTSSIIGGITAIVKTSQGSGYTPHGIPSVTYTNVPVSGGTGSGATVTVNVGADTIRSVTLVSQGAGYTVGDTLTVDSTYIGGTGSGFTFVVTKVSRYWTDVASTTAAFLPVGMIGTDYSGSGSPEGVKFADWSALYHDLSNGNIYIKKSAKTLSTGWKLIPSGTSSSLNTGFWTIQDNGSTRLDFINNSSTVLYLTRVSTSFGRLTVPQYSTGATAATNPAFGFPDGSGFYLDGSGNPAIFPFGASRGYVFSPTGLALDNGSAVTTTNLRLKASTASMSSLRIPPGIKPASPQNGDVTYDTTSSVHHLLAYVNGSYLQLDNAASTSSTLGNATVLADANYTITSSDYSLILPHTTASRTLTLPAASTMQNKILFIQNNGTASSDWVLSGSYFQVGTSSSTEDFINSGLDELASTILVSSKSQDNTWHWWRVASSGTASSGGAGTTTNSLTIGAELSPIGATSFDGSASRSIGIQSGSVTNAMLAGSIAASKLIETDISTVGTITTGTWHGSPIADTYISSAATWNAKQNTLSGTGYAKWSGSTPSYVATIPLTDLESTVASKSGSAQILTFTASGATITTGTSYTSFGNTSFAGNEKNRSIIIPKSGVLKNLYVLTGSTQPADGTLTISIERTTGNAGNTFTSTGITLTVAANATQNTFTDLTHTFNVTAGDIISINATNSSASASAAIQSISIVFQEQ